MTLLKLTGLVFFNWNGERYGEYDRNKLIVSDIKIDVKVN
jgi:hypothetical protein